MHKWLEQGNCKHMPCRWGLNHLLCITHHLKSETLIPQIKVVQKHSNKITSKTSKLTLRDSAKDQMYKTQNFQAESINRACLSLILHLTWQTHHYINVGGSAIPHQFWESMLLLERTTCLASNLKPTAHKGNLWQKSDALIHQNYRKRTAPNCRSNQLQLVTLTEFSV